MNKYDDIINLSRPKSKRPSMSIEARAAQFAPFSALTGYENAIKETSRITDKKKEITEGLKEIINEKLNYIKNNKYSGKIKITYFVKDKMKSGGKYITEEIKVKKIDSFNNKIICNNKEILFNDILDIEII